MTAVLAAFKKMTMKKIIQLLLLLVFVVNISQAQTKKDGTADKRYKANKTAK